MKTMTLNLRTGGTIDIPTASIVSVTSTHKGSIVVYRDGDEEKTIDVYEAPSRIKLRGEQSE